MPPPIQPIGFSVLIPTYQRAHLIPSLLDAWSRVEAPASGFEIILADDGSSHSPREIIEPYTRRMPLRFLQLTHHGLSPTRQSLLENATGRHVLITDDDCRPTPGLLREYEKAVALHPGHALGGPVINLLRDDWFAETTQLMTTFVTTAWNAGPNGACFFTGSNLLMPRASLERIGGFDRSWSSRTGEDRDLCRRWAEAGLQSNYVPEAIMGHAHRLDFPAFLRQHFHYGQGRWHCENRRRKRYAGPPAWSPPSFYGRLLLEPLRLEPKSKAGAVWLLLGCAQLATLAGNINASLLARR